MSKFCREESINWAIESVKECGFLIKYIPERFVTKELCETAMKQTDGHAYRFLPKKFQKDFSEDFTVSHENVLEAEEENQMSL